MRVTKTELKKIIREEIERALSEGKQDPGIFKAIFMAGCPGSGKGTAISAIFGKVAGFTPQGLKVVNPDDMYEYLLQREKLGLVDPGGKSPEDVEAMSPEEQEEYEKEKKAYRSQAGKLMHKAVTKTTGGAKGIDPEKVGGDRAKHGYKPVGKERPASRLETFINGRLGLLLDGTAANATKILREKEILEELGYDTMMVVVDVPVETALQRNRKRGEEGKRRIPDAAVSRACEKLQGNFDSYNSAFGDDYIYIDCSEDCRQVSPEIKKKVDKFISTKPSKPGAKELLKMA